MTVVVALACKDGLAMASDSQATEINTGSLLADVRFPTPKLFTLGEDIVWGASGDLGFIQRMKQRLDALQPNEKRGTIQQLRNTLRQTTTDVVRNAIKNFVQEVHRQNEPLPMAGFFLFAGRAKDGRFILEVKTTGADTQYEERGFHAIGSGYVHAQVAQGMLLHYDIKNRTTAQGLLIAYRVIDAAIDAAAAGIDHPVQLAVVQDGKPASVLTESERDNIGATVGAWKQAEIETLPGIYTQGE